MPPRTGVLVGVPEVLEAPMVDVLGRTYDRITIAADPAEDVSALPSRPALFVLSCLALRPTAQQFLDTAPDPWWADVERRLSTTYAWAKVAAATLARSGGGRIVLVVDQAGILGEGGASAEATISSAAIALTKSLGRELGPLGISVNAAAIPAGAASTISDPCLPARVAQTVAFLADQRLPRLVGQVITCGRSGRRSWRS